MKKYLLIFLVIVLSLLCGCGSNNAAENPDGSVAAASGEVQQAPETTKDADTDVPTVFSESAEPAVSVSPSGSPAESPSASPTASPSASPEPSATPTPTKAPEPYSQKTNSTVLTITGSGVDRDYYFTLSELKDLAGGYFEASYFSRGKEPVEASTYFKGLRVGYLFDTAVKLADGARKAYFTATDGYSAGFMLSDIQGTYIDETDDSKTLYMILAWEEDNGSIPLRLVMGQSIEGEYNRQFWVREVVTIEVRT